MQSPWKPVELFLSEPFGDWPDVLAHVEQFLVGHLIRVHELVVVEVDEIGAPVLVELAPQAIIRIPHCGQLLLQALYATAQAAPQLLQPVVVLLNHFQLPIDLADALNII